MKVPTIRGVRGRLAERKLQDDASQSKHQLPAHAPAVLYHYTTPSGLLGILQSHSLWASDVEFLTDAQELQFGREELHGALLKAADQLSASGAGGQEHRPRSAQIRRYLVVAAAFVRAQLEALGQPPPSDDIGCLQMYRLPN